MKYVPFRVEHGGPGVVLPGDDRVASVLQVDHHLPAWTILNILYIQKVCIRTYLTFVLKEITLTMK